MRLSTPSSAYDGAQSGAAFPLLVGGKAVGVMIYMSFEKETFRPEFVELLQRLADNVSFALENFDRADEKARTEDQKERLTRMLAAFSATNEAIMRARSRPELFELVCEAAAHGGKFTLTSIALIGRIANISTSWRPPVLPRPVGAKQNFDQRSPPGRARARWAAIRSRQACIINDYLGDPRAQAFHATARDDGANSGAAFPLFVKGQVIGVMVFMSMEKDTFTPEFAELLQRLADNVSFALENFDRVDEKARTEVQKERLTRMFAALSATNEAIIRANSRAELFDLVCEAAAKGGKFTSTTIGLARPDSDYLDFVAAAGPAAASARERENFDPREASGRSRASAARRSGRGKPASSMITSPTSAARRSMPGRATMARYPARRSRCSCGSTLSAS